jgi:hypothetical protein
MPQGFNQHGDILTKTVDGIDLNQLWSDYQTVIGQWNADRNKLVSFLTFGVTQPIENVPIVGQDANFERASEYGQPVGARPSVAEQYLAYDFRWYDLAARFTWQFLADAPAAQVDAVQNAALEADSRLVVNQVLTTLFSNANRSASLNHQPYNVYAFWNGDGNVPPKYKNNVFDGTHTHYLTTGTAALQPADLEQIIDNLDHHGYSKNNGYTQVVLVSKATLNQIRPFRSFAGANLSAPDATHGYYDFVPTANANQTLIIPQNVNIVGAQPPASFNGMDVMGSYGPLLIIQEDYVPDGYLAAFATGGTDNLGNPIGFRQHANASLQGMRLVKGRQNDYPLIDSFYVRGFGTGVRHRGAAVLMQITVSGTYTPPAGFVF